MYNSRLDKVEKKTFFFKSFEFFSSKVNPNGRGAKGDLSEHAWLARFSEFSRENFSCDFTPLHTRGCYVHSPFLF